MLGQFRPFVGPKLLPSILGLELFNEASFWADDEVVETHSGHFIEQPISDRLAETTECFIGLLFLGNFADQLDSGFEQLGTKRNPERSLCEGWILIARTWFSSGRS
jgi:hypothetical protein